MTTVTSIAALRASSAMQARVSQVEMALKDVNKGWQPDWLFPIAFIGESNGSDDMAWVRSHTSTHLKAKGSVRLIGTGDIISADQFITDVRTQGVNHPHWKSGVTSFTPFSIPVDTELEARVAAGVTTRPKAVKPAVKKTPATVSKTTSIKAPTKPTKLDAVKKLFNDLTPGQKLDMWNYVNEKCNTLPAIQAEKEKRTRTEV